MNAKIRLLLQFSSNHYIYLSNKTNLGYSKIGLEITQRNVRRKLVIRKYRRGVLFSEKCFRAFRDNGPPLLPPLFRLLAIEIAANSARKFAQPWRWK